MSKAMFSACGLHFSYECFSQCKWNLDETRSTPELAASKLLKGFSFNTKGLPCIVHIVNKGIIKIHNRNSGALWVSEKAKLKTGEKIVYMKCWHPLCQKETSCQMELFDAHGWALVSKADLERLTGNPSISDSAKI
jgi:hypothetical protein